MSNERIYNPLDKDHLAESIVREFFKGQLHPLPPSASFTGAGIYALYYRGDFPLYRDVSTSLTRFLTALPASAPEQPTPIYTSGSRIRLGAARAYLMKKLRKKAKRKHRKF